MTPSILTLLVSSHAKMQDALPFYTDLKCRCDFSEAGPPGGNLGLTAKLHGVIHVPRYFLDLRIVSEQK